MSTSSRTVAPRSRTGPRRVARLAQLAVVGAGGAVEVVLVDQSLLVDRQDRGERRQIDFGVVGRAHEPPSGPDSAHGQVKSLVLLRRTHLIRSPSWKDQNKTLPLLRKSTHWVWARSDVQSRDGRFSAPLSFK
jgi:hypothetical protein